MKVGCQSTFYRSLNLQPLAPTGYAADLAFKTYTGTPTIQMKGATGDLNITGTYLYEGSNILYTVQADPTTLSFLFLPIMLYGKQLLAKQLLQRLLQDEQHIKYE